MGKIRHFASFFMALAVAMTMLASNSRVSAATVEEEIHEIGVEAYLYLYPLVIMDVTRRQMTNIEAGRMPGRGPMNTFVHIPTFPPAEMRDVVRPNFDTLYSIAWLDLTKEPVIVSAPDTDGRYYMLPVLDMWTDVFANPGKRTTGTQEGHFALVPPGWAGTVPQGISRIDSPTGIVWIIGRTQTNGPKDYPAVHKVQAGFKITKLSSWGKKSESPAAVEIAPAIDMETPPMLQVHGMPPGEFFSYGAEQMKINPPHVTDNDIVARMKRIGIEAGKSFDFAGADPTVKKVLAKAAGDALTLMQAKGPTIAPIINGWQMNTSTIGVYGNEYLRRAIIAMLGLGANPPADAIYPFGFMDGDGNALDAANKYVLRFEKGTLPPVDAFWSVTLYDESGFPVPNDMNRNALGDRDALTFGTDGALELYFQSVSPGEDKETNWLPTPESGPFNLIMRLYAPHRQALQGDWVPPPVQKVR
jgi:hypothetical protein